jgi:hypothetical protein
MVPWITIQCAKQRREAVLVAYPTAPDGWGLRHRHRRLPPCAILRDLEHSNRSAASIDIPRARSALAALACQRARRMSCCLARPASVLPVCPITVTCSHTRLQRPFVFHAFSPTSLDPIPFRFVQHRILSILFPPVQHPPSTHTTKRLSRHSTFYIPTTASPPRHHLRNRPLASALLLANFRPSSAPPTQRTHRTINRISSITTTKKSSPQQCLTNTTTAYPTTLPSHRMHRTTLTVTMAAAGGARESLRRMRTGSSRRNATSRRSHPSPLRTRSTYSVWRLRRASNSTMTSSSARSIS